MTGTAPSISADVIVDGNLDAKATWLLIRSLSNLYLF